MLALVGIFSFQVMFQIGGQGGLGVVAERASIASIAKAVEIVFAWFRWGILFKLRVPTDLMTNRASIWQDSLR